MNIKEMRLRAKNKNRAKGIDMYVIKRCLHCTERFIGTRVTKWCMDCKKSSETSPFSQVGNQGALMWKKGLFEDQKKCFFCNAKEKLHAHHIDRDRSNNATQNLMLLCHPCHTKLHATIYKPILKRAFLILMNERFTYEEIADYFGTSKQNVYAILKRTTKLPTGALQK